MSEKDVDVTCKFSARCTGETRCTGQGGWWLVVSGVVDRGQEGR